MDGRQSSEQPPSGAIDWDTWRERLVQALDFRVAEPAFRDLFAPGGSFQDPNMAATTDIAAAEASTLAFCPDWHQELTSFGHGEDWAVFQWYGEGSFLGLPDGAAAGATMILEGMTMVSVDRGGRVTSWRDYLDRKEMIDQVKAAVRAGAEGPTS